MMRSSFARLVWYGAQAWDPQAPRRMPSRVRRGLLFALEAFCYLGLYVLLMGGWSVTVLLTDWYKALPFALK